jgi:AcrR family transcriptional regulator
MPSAVVTPIGAPRERLLSAALSLFVHHGVHGTSLQMIADELGVTKAAIYHQFQTKSDLVLAALAPAWDDMARMVEAAESHRSVTARREVAVSGLVDLVVKNRRMVAVLYADPVVTQLVRENPAMTALGRRIKDLVAGPDQNVDMLVGAAVLGGGLMMVGTDPDLDELDDETLRRHLLATARRALHLRTPARRRT